VAGVQCSSITTWADPNLESYCRFQLIRRLGGTRLS